MIPDKIIIAIKNNHDKILFIGLSLTSNLFSVLIPLILAASLTTSDYANFSIGMILGVLGFALSSYGFENTLLRISASTDSKVNIAHSEFIRFVLLSALTLTAFCSASKIDVVLTALWASLSCLFNRGIYDHKGRQLQFSFIMLLDKAVALTLALFTLLPNSDLTIILCGLNLARFSIALSSYNSIIRTRDWLKLKRQPLFELIKTNKYQAITTAALACITITSPLILGYFADKQAVAKYYFNYQFGYLIPIVFGYASRYIYIKMYQPNYTLTIHLKKITPHLLAFWAISFSIVFLLYYLVLSTKKFSQYYFDPKLIMAFGAWNIVYIYGSLISAYLISRRSDRYILKSNIIGILSLLITSAILIPPLKEIGAAISMTISHLLIILMYSRKAYEIEKNNLTNS